MSSSKNKIELQIDFHPSGNYTLKQRAYAQTMWQDFIEEGLIANSNRDVFYKAVVGKIANLIEAGNEIVSIKDAAP